MNDANLPGIELSQLVMYRSDNAKPKLVAPIEVICSPLSVRVLASSLVDNKLP